MERCAIDAKYTKSTNISKLNNISLAAFSAQISSWAWTFPMGSSTYQSMK